MSIERTVGLAGMIDSAIEKPPTVTPGAGNAKAIEGPLPPHPTKDTVMALPSIVRRPPDEQTPSPECDLNGHER